VSDKI